MEEVVLWNITEAAKYLSMSVAYLRKQVRLRAVPFFRIGGKAIRFRRSELDAWLGAHSNGGELRYSKK